MAEFCDPDAFMIYLAVDEEHWKQYSLRELLPEGFTPENLRY
jgi:cytidine deaminase